MKICFVRLVSLLVALCLLGILLCAGCAKQEHEGEAASVGQEYLVDVLSGEIAKITFLGGGGRDTVVLADKQEIASAVALMERFDVMIAQNTTVSEPGAASIDVIFQYVDGTEKSISFPCFLVNGVTYEALFDGEGVYFQHLDPVVHWPSYQKAAP